MPPSIGSWAIRMKKTVFDARAIGSGAHGRIPASLSEPIAELNLALMQGQADSMFGDILLECSVAGRFFPDVANSAFRKRESGAPLDVLESMVLTLFGKIDAMEAIREMRP